MSEPQPPTKKEGTMRLTNITRYTLFWFFSRATIILTYWLITLSICIQVMIRGSLLVGASALVACALCYWGAAAYIDTLLARRETAIGVLAVILIMAGQALVIWSDFMVRLFDIEIGGAFWALIGAATAVALRVRDPLTLLPLPQYSRSDHSRSLFDSLANDRQPHRNADPAIRAIQQVKRWFDR
jgi:hypothetical protein